MKTVKFDIFDDDRSRWVISEIGVENIEYDFRSHMLTFLNDEDTLFYLLKFGEKIEL